MSSPIKIQINSLKVLEKLIGGNSDLELEIRNNIVQEFSKKYLKHLVTKEFEITLSNMIRESVFSTGKEYMPEINTFVKQKYQETVKELITNQVKNTLIENKHLIYDQVKKSINLYLRDYMEKEITTDIKARFDKWFSKQDILTKGGGK